MSYVILYCELEGGNIELTGTIPSGMWRFQDFWRGHALILNISDTNIIPDWKLCAQVDCGVSSISTLAPPSSFTSIMSSIQDFLSARFCIKIRILADPLNGGLAKLGRLQHWKTT